MIRWFSLLIFLMSFYAQADTETFQFPANNQKTISIRNSFGNVSLAPATSNTISIVANKTKWGKRCKMQVAPGASTFQVEINDEGWIMDNECRADLIVSVPVSFNVILRAGNGVVNIAGTRGNVDVKVGSGTLTVKSDLKKLSALLASGDIHFDGRAENTQVSTSNGNIDFRLMEKTSGRIFAKSSNGDVMISLPETSKVHSKTTVGNGLVRNTFPNAEKEAEIDLEVHAGNGDIRIREN